MQEAVELHLVPAQLSRGGDWEIGGWGLGKSIQPGQRETQRREHKVPSVHVEITLHQTTSFRTITGARSEEHTSELQSPCNLVCRLLLEKKKQNKPNANTTDVKKIDSEHGAR